MTAGSYSFHSLMQSASLSEVIANTETLKKETLQLLGAVLNYIIGDAVRAGNYKVASYMCMQF